MHLKITASFVFIFLSFTIARSQDILNRARAKASKTADKTIGNTSDNSNAQATVDNDKKKQAWCDNIPSHAGDAFRLAYSSTVNFSIMYDESRLAINGNTDNYRLVLKQQVGNKAQFVIVKNGKITATVAALSKEDIAGGLRRPLDGLQGNTTESANEQYLIAEKNTTVVAAQDVKTVTTPQSINAKQVAAAYEMMKNSPEYKKMSPEEKQKMEEAMKQMPQLAADYNNSGMGGKTISTPAVKEGVYSAPSGYYSVVVKTKNYGKFLGVPQLQVSEDETNVYIVGSDDKGKSNFIANGKKIPLTATGDYMPHTGYLLMSPDGKKAAFAEIKQLTEKEQEEMLKNMQTGGNTKQEFIVTKSDGTTSRLTRTDGNDKFRVLNSGALVYVNAQNGEVVADGKKIGQFTIGNGEELNSDALLFGDDASKICYYSENGSLHYMDGSKKELDILFPQVIRENNKSYLTWFRKCRNDIYIGKLEL